MYLWDKSNAVKMVVEFWFMEGNHLVKDSEIFWDGRERKEWKERKAWREISSIMKTAFITESYLA